MMRKDICYVFLVCLLAACEVFCLAQGLPKQDEVLRISDALRNHDFQRALTLSKAALERQPNDYKLWTLRGMATEGMGDVSGALSAYQRALKLAPTYLPALEGAAQSEFEIGQDGARPMLLRVLAQSPEDPTANAMVGVLAYRSNNCSEAVTHFQKATAAIARQPAALTEYGSCLAALKQDDEAVSVFAQAFALDPSKNEARYNLALAQWNAHQTANALATLTPMTETTAVNEEVAILAAEILESQGDTEHAVPLLRNAIVANPRDARAYLQFASLSFDHASPQVGIDILNAGLTQLPREPRLYLVRGVLLAQSGEFSRASEDFAAANRIDPHLDFLGVAQGLIESQLHNSAESLTQFRAAVRAHPNQAYAYYLLAEKLEELGKPEGSPEYKEEVDAATKAVTLDPSLVAAHDLLGGIHLENGHIKLAIEQSHEALALDASDQQAIYHLIVALRQSDQKDLIPVLLKRLIELRTSAETQQAPAKRFRLYEVQSSTGLTSPRVP